MEFNPWTVVITVVCALISIQILLAVRRSRRAAFIKRYTFPPSIREKVRERYPHLSDAQLRKVMDGLREYFQVCNYAGRRFVSMPSQVVDVAWHEFILFTRRYDKFCTDAFGRFLHHTPAEAMTDKTNAQDGIKRAWRLSCKLNSVNAQAPKALPLLFAIDDNLDIDDGFTYDLDCEKSKRDSYCASHIGCGGGCAGDSGSCAGDSGCGGGCGGD